MAKYTSRRLLGYAIRIVRRTPEDYAYELQEWLESLFGQVEGGIPAGFNDLTPNPLDPNSGGSSGSESSGWAAADHVHELDLLLDTKGDLLTFDGSLYVRLPAGTEALYLEADPAATTGLRYGPIVLTPSTITGNQNNYAPGRANVYHLATDASRNLTGLVAGTHGEFRLAVNTGAFNLVLKHDDAASTEANRFICPSSTDLTLLPGDAAYLSYDDTTDRWRAYHFVGGVLTISVPAGNGPLMGRFIFGNSLPYGAAADEFLSGWMFPNAA